MEDTGEMEENIVLLGYYVTTCPYCLENICIPQYRAMPITLRDFQDQTARQVKAMKEARDKEKKAK